MKNFNKIFELANLEVSSNSEIEKDFEKIVNWVEKLKEVNTEDVKPPEVYSNIMILRKDIKNKFEGREGILLNIPEKKDDFFVVPRVVKNG